MFEKINLSQGKFVNLILNLIYVLKTHINLSTVEVFKKKKIKKNELDLIQLEKYH